MYELNLQTTAPKLDNSFFFDIKENIENKLILLLIKT